MPHDEPTAKPDSGAPSVDVASTEVLITEQEVLFGTRGGRGAGAVAERQPLRARVTPAARGAGPKRYGFLERALMAREMGRL